MQDQTYHPCLEVNGHDLTIFFHSFGPYTVMDLVHRCDNWYQTYKKNPEDTELQKQQQELEDLLIVLEKAPWVKNKHCFDGIENLDPMLQKLKYIIDYHEKYYVDPVVASEIDAKLY